MPKRDDSEFHGDGVEAPDSPAADLVLPGVIGAAMGPVVLLVIAAEGGGLPMVVVAFVALVAILWGLVKMLGRAI